MDSGDVLVGVDGSEPSRQALRWAAEEASRCGAPLHILLAYGAPAGLGPPGRPPALSPVQAGAIVDQAVAEARRVAPGVIVTSSAVPTSPAHALLEGAEKARLVVVGNRGRGGFVTLPLGSVSLRIATHASCPVAVVRGEPEPGSPVVIAVNGSGSERLVAPAGFDQAARRGCAVVVARGYPARDIPHDREARRTELVRAVAPWRGRYPHVPVDYVPFQGPVTGFLTHLSYRAQLIVLGSRGSNGFTGLLLGSTTQHLIHNAGCPVLVTRPREEH